MKKIMSAHQPDIFPYIGFFNKMNRSDFFDLAIYDEYSKGRYMDRVKMGALHQQVWVNVPIERKSRTMIKDILLKDSWKDLLRERIVRQYRGFEFFSRRFYLVERVLDNDFTRLSQVGEESILSISDFFGIDCEIMKLGDNLPKGTDGIIELTKRYKEKTKEDIIYLSGDGGKAYLDEKLIEENKVEIIYNEFETKYKCSSLTPIFELENPKEIIE